MVFDSWLLGCWVVSVSVGYCVPPRATVVAKKSSSLNIWRLVSQMHVVAKPFTAVPTRDAWLNASANRLPICRV